MRALAHLARQSKDALANQVCRYAQVAVAHPTSYVETMPAELPWKSALSQLQQTQVRQYLRSVRLGLEHIRNCRAWVRSRVREPEPVPHFQVADHLMCFLGCVGCCLTGLW